MRFDPDKKLARLKLKSLAEKEETKYTFKEMIDFVKWYSGMEQGKVVSAWNRYAVEVRLKP